MHASGRGMSGLGANQSFKRARQVAKPIRPGAGMSFKRLQPRRLVVNSNQLGSVKEHGDTPKNQIEAKELTREEAEVKKNLERLETDLKQGMMDLLDLHNTEELRGLCLELEIHGSGSKKRNLAKIWDSIDPEQDLERECARILKHVWDGIVIEYLRNAGKNLLKCRDNLRGAAISHWKRNTVAIAVTDSSDECSSIPIYMRDTVWMRTNPTSTADEKVQAFLSGLHESERELKEYEKQLRVKPDYTTVVHFLNKVGRTRLDEANFRDEMLTIMQELLGERDVVLGNEKAAVAEALECRQSLEALVKREKATNYFRGLNDALQRERLLENIRTQVELVHREKDIEQLNVEMEQQRQEFEAEKDRLNGIIQVTTMDLHETREAFRMTHENYQQDHADLKETRRLFQHDKVLFDKYRQNAQAYVDQSIADHALECAKHQVTIASFQHAVGEAQHKESELRAELEGVKAQSQARLERAETWEMTCADMEAKRYELEVMIAAARPPSNQSSGSRRSTGSKKPSTADSKKKGKKGKKSPKGKKSGKKKDKKTSDGEGGLSPGSPGSPSDLDGNTISPLPGEAEAPSSAKGKKRATVIKKKTSKRKTSTKPKNSIGSASSEESDLDASVNIPTLDELPSPDGNLKKKKKKKRKQTIKA